MALRFLNRCGFRATSSGGGSFVVASALTGMQVPEDAAGPAVEDGETYRYFAESDDKTQWEIGFGVYTTSDDTLTRATVLDNSSGGTTALSFSAAPQVFMGGPLANEVAFRGPEDVTTGGSPVDADINTFLTNVTSGGTAGTEQLDLPTLTQDEVGLLHLVRFAVQSDPADKIDISAGGTLITLVANNGFALFMWGAASWVLLTGDGVLPDATSKVYYRSPSGLASFESDPGLILLSEAEIDLASASDCNTDVHTNYILTDGSGTESSLSISGGDVYGQELLIYISNLVDPGDTISLDTTLLRFSGSQPVSIIFSAADQAALLKWSIDPASPGDGFWDIIQVTNGVVTP